VAVSLDPAVLLTLAEDLPVALCIARMPGGERIYVNRAHERLAGPAGSLALCGRDGAPYPAARLPEARAVTERRTVIVDDLAIVRGDGARIAVRAIAWPAGSSRAHIAIAYLDVQRETAAEEARISAEHRLVRGQRLETVGALAANVAHELNNMVFGVKMIAADLALSEPDPGRREAIAEIDELTERSAVLTRSLLGFARRTGQRATIAGVNDAVAALRELLVHALTGVELTFALDASDHGAVLGDPAEIEDLVVHLALSARDAAHGASRVTIRTRDLAPPSEREPARVVLEVSDDGPAIAPARDDNVVDRAAPGVESIELGLEAVRASVAHLGGALEIEPGPDGRGLTLRIILRSPRRTPARTTRPPIADLPRGSGTILVIDDEQTIRRIVSNSLGALGYRTVEAANGSEAIEIYRGRHHEIRAVVLDMVMPGLTGRATYLALREIDPTIPVLLMSGHTMDEHVQEILDLGVRSFLSKPYSIGALARAMSDLLR